ncbi:MAG: hypothetical protein ABSD41_07420 [Candidatus Bathyarchaeia archaeon]
MERRSAELRFIDGIEKVEHVPFSTGDQFWVRFNRPIDLKRLQGVVRSNGCKLIKFGGLPSKLPRKLSEVLWSGVTHVIVKKGGGFEKFTSMLGFEPVGIAKIVTDLHGPYQIFIATDEDGVHVLYDYLGLKYVPPAPPPPKAAPPPKPPTPAAKPPSTPPPPAPAPQVPAAPAKPATVTAPPSTLNKEAAPPQ